jgi:DNA-binding XRE family transcriptional regulator
MSRNEELPLFNRIAQVREEIGLSRKALAESVGVHYQTIGYLERGEYSPSLSLALRIAGILGRPVEELFSVTAFESEQERTNGE